MDKNSKRHGVSLVIPNYNGKDLLAENLPKVLAAAKNPKNQILEVIVVDDGSRDESVKFLKSNFPEVSLIKHTKNRGFPTSVNSGVNASKGRFVVLLNNDVFPQRDFLEEVLDFMAKDEKIFAVSFHEKGYGWADGKFENGFIIHLPGTEDLSPHPTFYVNAGGAIYRRDLWISLGGMDAGLYSPFYWEDVDISYRAAKRGQKLFWHPGAYVSPNLSATVSKIPQKRVARIQQRNQLLFIWKNLTSQNLFRKHLVGLLRRTLKHPGYIRIVFMAILKLAVVVKARRREMKECKVSDEAIFTRF